MLQKSSCMLPWSHLRLANNGFYCCCEIVSLGAEVNNFHYQQWNSLQEAWNSAHYQGLRSNMHTKGVEFSCNKYGAKPFKCKFWPSEFQTSLEYTDLQNQNILNMMKNAESGSTSASHYPYHIQIIMDAKCNLACEHCFQEPYKRKDNRIVIPDLHDELVEFAKHAVTIEIIGGEATIYKDYMVLLDILKEAQGAKLSLVTNGHFLKDKVVPYLDLYRHVGISTDAATSDVYQIMRPSPSKKYDWANLITQIRLLVQANNKRDKPIRLDMNSTICGHNFHEMPAMISNAHELGIGLYYFNEIMDDEYKWLTPDKKSALLNHLNQSDRMFESLVSAIQVAKEKGVILYYSLPSIQCVGSSLDPLPIKPKVRNLKPVPILQSQSVDLKTALDPHWAICTGNILSIYKSMEDAKKHNIQKVIYVGDEPGAKLLLDSFTWLKQKIILNRSHFAYLQDHEYQIIKNGLLSRNREVLDSLLRQLDYGLTSSHVLNVSLRDQNPIVDDGKPWAYIGGAWGDVLCSLSTLETSGINRVLVHTKYPEIKDMIQSLPYVKQTHMISMHELPMPWIVQPFDHQPIADYVNLPKDKVVSCTMYYQFENPVQRPFFKPELPKEAFAEAEQLIQEYKSFILTMPYSLQSSGANEHWPYWNDLLLWIADNAKIPLLVVGELGISDLIPKHKNIINLCGKTSSMLPVYAMAQKACLNVCTINSLAHYVDTMGLPVFSIGNKLTQDRRNAFSRIMSPRSKYFLRTISFQDAKTEFESIYDFVESKYLPFVPKTDDIELVFSKLPGISSSDLYQPWCTKENYQPWVDISKALDVRSYLEIGSRVGHSMIAIACGSPQLETIHWIDNQTYIANSNQLTALNLQSFVDFYRNGKMPVITYETDWTDQNQIYDLATVDGGHDYDQKLVDLNRVKLCAKMILIDDLDYLSQVKTALLDWCHEHGHQLFKVNTLRGLGVIDLTPDKHMVKKLIAGGIKLQVVI